MKRLERLLDLVHVLQTAHAPVSLDALRELFPDYAEGNHDATRRKFERDKAELAELGLVLRYVADEDAEHGGQGGYWLDADASYLAPEINLSSLPSWELLARDRGQLVVRRTRSYAKAIAALRGLEAEGRFGQLRPLPAGS